jgi:hypothetical protein
MDRDRFDQLSRGLAGAKTRRQVLRGLFVGAVAAASGVAPRAAEAAAPKPDKCVPEGGACKSDKKCCLGACCNGKCCSQQCLGGTTCCGGEFTFVCGNSCCPKSTFNDCCNGVCVNTNLNSENCGGCGKLCPPGSICDGAGKCRCFEPGPQPLLCNGMCVDSRKDSNNCGVCGKICDSGQTCIDGRCDCGPGKELCLVDPNSNDFECITIATDPANCGFCRNDCRKNAGDRGYWVCEAGECACDPQAPCGPGEVTDPTTCECTCSPEPCPPGGFVWDPVACVCKCPADYTFGTDPHTGQQMCCPNHCLQPGGLCCFDSQVCVGSAGSATCCSTDANGNPVC